MRASVYFYIYLPRALSTLAVDRSTRETCTMNEIPKGVKESGSGLLLAVLSDLLLWLYDWCMLVAG